jgi:hypothetical protein
MTRRAGGGTDAQVTAARDASGTHHPLGDRPVRGARILPADRQHQQQATRGATSSAHFEGARDSRPVCTGRGCRGDAAHDATGQQGKGWIACTRLPDIGDLAFDHRAIAMVGDCPPEVARLAVATGAWFSQIGATWSVRRDGNAADARWEIDSGEENMTARCAPVSPGVILDAWAGLRRVMVVHALKDAPPLAYVFEPLAVPMIAYLPTAGENGRAAARCSAGPPRRGR